MGAGALGGQRGVLHTVAVLRGQPRVSGGVVQQDSMSLHPVFHAVTNTKHYSHVLCCLGIGTGFSNRSIDFLS